MRARGIYILQPAIFKSVLDVFNFSMTSKLFDSNKPYAISMHYRKRANKMHHISQSTQNRVQKFKQNLPENYSKSTKIAITAYKFSKIFRRSMPPDLL